jgi:hypothetical protein
VRFKPTAARVPKAVARHVVAAATARLFATARRHCSELSKYRYHRLEIPAIGYEKKGSAFNESGRTTRMGAVRKASTKAQKILSP